MNNEQRTDTKRENGTGDRDSYLCGEEIPLTEQDYNDQLYSSDIISDFGWSLGSVVSSSMLVGVVLGALLGN